MFGLPLSLTYIQVNKTTIEILEQQNQILINALQSQIDYHHHIGNEDCPYTTNQVLNQLYKLVVDGLAEVGRRGGEII